MKTILLRVSIFLLITLTSCTEESCKTCTSTTSYDGVLQDELNWTAEYCNEELVIIENSNPMTSYSDEYGNVVTLITCN